MQQTTNEETDLLLEAQGAFLKAVTNMPAYVENRSFGLDLSIAMGLVEGLSIFSVDSAKEMLKTALEYVTEHDRKVRYEAEIQEHVEAGGKYVNIYEIDHNNYGGAAEGGWYYTSGTPLSIGYNRDHNDPDYRHHSQQRLRNTTKVNALDDPEQVEYEVTEALVDAGNGSVRLKELISDNAIDIKIEDRPAEYWPAVKPHYE